MLDVLTGVVWVFAGLSDLLYNKVSNWVFVVLSLLGAIHLAQMPAQWALVAAGLLVTIPAGLILPAYTDMGGADSKALCVLVLLFPLSWPLILGAAALLSLPVVQLQDDVPFVSVLVVAIGIVSVF